MTKATRKVRIFGRIFFVAYMILALYFMFFSETLDRTMVSDQYRYNLTLFKEITRFWNMHHIYEWNIKIINLLGNVVCFMPFGFLLQLVSKRSVFKNFLSVTFLAMLFSIGIETAQLVTKVGAFDVDDIFLNTIGGLLGYIFLKFTKLRKHI